MNRANVEASAAFRELWQTLRAVGHEWDQDEVPRLAASLAYYALFSLAPLLVVAVGLVGLFFSREVARGEVVSQFQELIGRQGATAVEGFLAGADSPEASGWAALIGLATLLIGASGVFGELQVAMNTIWDVAPRPGAGWKLFLRRRFLSFAMVLGTGFLLLVSLLLSASLAAVGRQLVLLLPMVESYWANVDAVLGVALPALLFALIFKFVPDAEVQWRDVWVGALFTAMLFALGRSAIGYYLGRSAFDSTYGAAGSLVAVVAWVYYSAQILFLGAELTQVLESRRTSRAHQPVAGADRVVIAKAHVGPDGTRIETSGGTLVRGSD